MAQHQLPLRKLKKTIKEIELAHQRLDRIERRSERFKRRLERIKCMWEWIKKHLGIDLDTETTGAGADTK